MSADAQPSAAQRLALSRERLRLAMVRGASGTADTPAGSSDSPGPASDWLAGLTSIPVAGVVIAAVRSWWAQNPMRIAGMVAVDAAKGMVRPLAKRHPLGLVIGAALVGGLLVWAKPWRGILKPALLAGLLPHLASRAMAAVPVESWMAVLTSLAQQPARPEQAAAPEGETPPQSSMH